MTPEERIIALERDLIETRLAAARMMLAMANAMASTPQQNRVLIEWLEAAAANSDPAGERVALLVAAALRLVQRDEGHSVLRKCGSECDSRGETSPAPIVAFSQQNC